MHKMVEGRCVQCGPEAQLGEEYVACKGARHGREPIYITYGYSAEA